jgi:hypothetical protein
MPKSYIPGESSYKRLYRNNRYKKLGLDYEVFLNLIAQDCLYCGSPPRRINPYGSVFKNYRSMNNMSETFWNDSWIFANGVDKMSHQDDYSDISNLVPCCFICNFMKQRMTKDAFIEHCNRISNRHAI